MFCSQISAKRVEGIGPRCLRRSRRALTLDMNLLIACPVIQVALRAEVPASPDAGREGEFNTCVREGGRGGERRKRREKSEKREKSELC